MRCPELAVQECLTLGEIMVDFCSDFRGGTYLWPNKGAREISEVSSALKLPQWPSLHPHHDSQDV